MNGSRISSTCVGLGNSLGASMRLSDAVGHFDFVGDRGGGLHDFDVEFAFQALLDDLHVQKARETRSETRSPARRWIRE